MFLQFGSKKMSKSMNANHKKQLFSVLLHSKQFGSKKMNRTKNANAENRKKYVFSVFITLKTVWE